jgi:excisionase family DNA binding protein
MRKQNTDASAASRGLSLLIDDAAQLLGVSRRTVYYRIRQGRLQTIRTRCGSQRVLLSSIEVLLREGRGLSNADPSEDAGSSESEEDVALQPEPLPL